MTVLRRSLPLLLALLIALSATIQVARHRQHAYLYFAKIPGGNYLMGSPPGETGREADETLHPVFLSSFLMSKFLVTQDEWRSVMNVNPSYFRGDGRLPVEGVTWYNAIAFCNRLSEREGLQPCYRLGAAGTDPDQWPKGWNQSLHDEFTCNWTAEGYRLPTEAEWEYVCRAGTSTATLFGNSLTSRQANFNGEEPYGTSEKGPFLRRTTPLGSYAPNAWGLFDMLGNVSEWCWDWYADYDLAKPSDPRGPAKPTNRRVYRGGSWFSFGVDLRSAARFGDKPQFRLDMLPGGLRLVRKAE